MLHPDRDPEWVGAKQLCRCWGDRGLETVALQCACGHRHPFDPATVTDEFLVRVGIVVEVVPEP